MKNVCSSKLNEEGWFLKMRNKWFFGLGVLLVFGFMLTACNSGSGIAPNVDNGKGLIGTWIDEEDNSETVFNADGTGSSDDISFKYGVIGNKLASIFTQRGQPLTTVWDFYISSDGKTLILQHGAANVTLNNGSLLRKVD
jgi:hypothetical protein